MRKLTVGKIAELAGVSKATVSRVLNRYPHISPEVRNRVEKVIAETGFRPNSVARSLALERSNIIGLVIPSGPKAVFTDPYFPVVTQGISKMSNRLDLTLALFLFQSLEEERVTIQSILVTGLLDGLIITSDYRDDSFLPQLFEYEMPFVLIGRPDNADGINFIDTDNVDGARIATEHLIGLGYERIATIASDQNTSGDDRLRGYREAMQASGRPVRDELIAYGDYSLESGYERMKQLLPHKPDAVFAASDTMALGALSALREAGMRVPQDVAIVGYDDLPPAVQADPPLTTIRQPIEQTGILAVETLKQIISDSNQPPRQMILPVELVVRQSCGAV